VVCMNMTPFVENSLVAQATGRPAGARLDVSRESWSRPPRGCRENAGMNETGCVFCDLDKLLGADVYFENAFCVYASTRDPR